MNWKEMSLESVTSIFQRAGATQLFIKYLAENDNSKNQIYLGHNYAALNILPLGPMTVDNSKRGSRYDRFKASISFYWLTKDGQMALAPHAQLILYPNYPEVRLSGFLKACPDAPSDLMNVRIAGRAMLLGITEDRKVMGLILPVGSLIVKELSGFPALPKAGVFLDGTTLLAGTGNARKDLFLAVKSIYDKGWIEGKRLSRGKSIPYDSPNGGGYTFEAELGINPNGDSVPDYMGWEIKQYGSRDLEIPQASHRITLMTPEPTQGEYKSLGVEKFIRKYGYPDRHGRADRFNFGGIYISNLRVESTGLTLALEGFDPSNCKIMKPEGGIVLLNDKKEVAAKWMFTDLLSHWNRKHNRTAYIPSITRTEPSRAYRYGAIIDLGEGTEFPLFLLAINGGKVYYDPGIKLEDSSTAKPTTKRRSQFRVKFPDLKALYHHFAPYDVRTYT